MPTDEQRIAFERINWILDTKGDGPEYRSAWAEWALLSGSSNGADRDRA